MNILLVEDDDFKAADIAKVIAEVSSGNEIEKATSVTSALKAMSNRPFDLVILDMSLPTFDMSGPGGGGSPQAQGGIEVLRLAKRLRHQPNFIIVTQYPDIEIESREIPLNLAARILSTEFGLKLIGCLLHEFESDAWRIELAARLKKFFSQQ